MRAAFRKADLTKAYQAVENGGGFVRAVEIEPNGKIRLLTGRRDEQPDDAIDAELREFDARNGYG